MKLLYSFIFCWPFLLIECEDKLDVNNVDKLVPEVISTDRRNNVVLTVTWERGNVTKLKDAGIGKIGLVVNAGRKATDVKKEIIRYFAGVFEISEMDIRYRSGKKDYEKLVILDRKAISSFIAMEKIMQAIDKIPIGSKEGLEESDDSTRRREVDEKIENLFENKV